MSNENPLSIIKTDVNLDKNDLLTIVVSRAEKMMNQHISAGLTNVKELEKMLKTRQESLQRALDSVARKMFSKQVDELERALVALGAVANDKPKLTVNYTSVFADNNKSTIKVGISISQQGNHGAFSFNTTVNTPHDVATESVLANSTIDELNSAREDVVNWRRKLSNLPSLEREYKAKLVEHQLSQSEEGKKLLNALDLNSFADSVLALPGV